MGYRRKVVIRISLESTKQLPNPTTTIAPPIPTPSLQRKKKKPGFDKPV